MTKSTITRERLEKIKSWRETYGAGSNVMLPAEEADELARIALSALDSEPVAYTDEAELCFVNDMACMWTKGMGINEVPLYRHAQQPVAVTDDELNAALQLHRLKVDGHSQLSDSFRAGFRYARRTTPQPAPVVPAVSDDIGEIRVGRLPTMNQDDYPGLGDWWVQLRIGEDSDEVLARVYGATPQEANNRAEALACRAAMLQDLQKSAGADVICRSNENAQVLNTIKAPPALGSLPKNAKSLTGNSLVVGIDLASGPDRTVEVRYVAPPGYVMVPKVATEKMLIAGLEEADPLGSLIDWDASRGDCNTREQVQGMFEAMLAAAPQEVKGE